MHYQVQACPSVQIPHGTDNPSLPNSNVVEHDRAIPEITAWSCHWCQSKLKLREPLLQDWLTGPPSHVQFHQQLLAELSLARQHQNSLAIMVWDLDDFQAINRRLGHELADQVLQQVAQKLASALRAQDIVLRWYADTFVLILPNLKAAGDVDVIVQRLHQVLAVIFEVQGQEVSVQSSCGIAIFPQDGATPWTLLSKAHRVLQVAKTRKCSKLLALRSVQKPVERGLEISLSESLGQALHNQALVLHYQPQLNLVTGEVNRVEALLRWQHPELGLMHPSVFMAQAEESGLIVPIGLWVLRQACLQIRAWQRAGLPPLQVAVNVSARQLQEPDLVTEIEQVLLETGLSAQFLELEITETAAMQNLGLATQVLQTLHDMGVAIALDDFGTGFSSLGYLKTFPVDCVKIDQTFVQGACAKAKDRTMLRAIIALAQALKLAVVAEGVETLEQVNWLRSHHCHTIQGYWFSRPLTATAMTDFLAPNHYRKVLDLIDWQLPLLDSAGAVARAVG